MRRLTRHGALLISFLFLLALPATAGAAIDGKLKQLPLPSGCLDDATAQGCGAVTAPMTNIGEPAMSMDGRFLYVPARDSNSLNWFERNTSTGGLTERGCLRFGAATGCTNLATSPATDVSPLDDATGAAVSHDNDGIENLYVVGGAAGGGEPDGIASFTIDSDGAPSFLGCVNSDGSGACTQSPGLNNPMTVTVSPDGKSVYLASQGSPGAIVVFQRNKANGLLSQVLLSATEQCLKRDNTEGCAINAQVELPRDVEVTPDNKSVIWGTPSCATFPGCYSTAAADRNTTTGVLTAQPGTEGCINLFASGCQGRGGVGFRAPNQLAITNDGQQVLYAGRESCCTAVYTVSRNPSNNNLTPLTPCTEAPASSADCTQESKALAGNGGGGIGLHDIALSPDNRYVYTASFEGQRIGIFDLTSSGGLGLRPGDQGCLAASNQTDGCGGVTQGGTNTNIEYVQPSPDGKNVYAFGSGGGVGKIFTFAVDHAPRCSDQSVNTTFNTSVTIHLSCSDADGDPLTFQTLSQPGKGQLGAVQGDQVTYGPFPATSGPDSFTFRATGGGVESDIATLTVNVAGGSAGPGAPTGPSGGGGGALTVVPSTASINSLAFPKFTKLVNLSVKNLQAGTTVRVTCKTKKKKQQKKGCPYKSKRFTTSGARAKLNLRKPFKNRKIPVGTKITITITAPGFLGKRVTYTIRARKLPKSRVQCLSVTGKVGSCA